MRILGLTNLYPSPLQPQRATFNRERFRWLAKRHEVRVIAPVSWTDEWSARRKASKQTPLTRRRDQDGVSVEHPRYWYTPKVLRNMYGRFFLESVRKTFRRAVEEFEPDLLFAPWAYPDGWAAVKLGRRHNIPVVILVQGSDVSQMNHIAGRRRGTQVALREADGVMAVSNDLAERVIALGVENSRVRAILGGVNQSVFFPGERSISQQHLGLEPKQRHLLFVGNLVPMKGVDVLLHACSNLGSTAGDWHLHLVGNGGLREQLVKMSHSLGIEHRVSFHGSIPHHELPDWFRAADLLVLPSRFEGVPNVLLEASACGTPYVASSVGGIPEIGHLGAGRLVSPNSPRELAEAIQTCLATPPRQPSQGPRDLKDVAGEMSQFLIAVHENVTSRNRQRS